MMDNPLYVPPPFIVAAPGKTILCGEHAVVFSGYRALAAAISLRSYMLCTALATTERTLTVIFEDIGLNHTWNIKDLPWDYCKSKDKSHPSYHTPVRSLDDELMVLLEALVADVGQDAEPGTRKVMQCAGMAFLYLFVCLRDEDALACEYVMRSAIPVGMGLGSSASISACISAALLLQSGAIQAPARNELDSEEACKQLAYINNWAYTTELMFHHRPSGVDNTVSTQGGVIVFSRPNSIRTLPNVTSLPFLLIDSMQPKSTAKEVAKVQELNKMWPQITKGILYAIDNIVHAAKEALRNWDFDKIEDTESLGRLLEMNHSLLDSLGVSHPRLERIRSIIKESGLGWTKLTGSGGGGCAIALMRWGDVDPEEVEALKRKLQEEGFKIYQVKLGIKGVAVLDSAVVKSCEISKQTFLQAERIDELMERDDIASAWQSWSEYNLEDM
ncbi:mevalonate kinase [Piedraia hortae CBS 480.64]|uniref:Mevalonate kinase n=1 Tax=Piedraia hortae CBS 480.64 TaxID=1314780 RepID=A0A6A7C8J1_9PEZI|nr:mevalonate kinase [Piedraia hortae CBS 480.64]